MNKIASKTIWHKKQRFLWAKGLAICFCAILLMSHNTSALQLAIDIEPNWTQYTFKPVWYYTSSGESSSTTAYGVSVPSSAGSSWTYSVNKVRLYIPAGMAQNSGGYLVYSFKLDNFVINDSIDGNFMSACVVSQGSLDSSLSVIDVSYQTAASTGYQVDVTLTNNSTISSSSSARYFDISDCNSGSELLYLKAGERVRFTEANFYKVKSNTNYTSSINDVKNSINSLGNKLDDINSHFESEENAVDNIENQDPSDIGSSENAGTTNLVGALSGFITTIANTPASNCLINGDMGNLDIGSVNLCQGKEHFNTLIEFIGFTALFGVVFWAGYHLVKRTLSLIDWARSK